MPFVCHLSLHLCVPQLHSSLFTLSQKCFIFPALLFLLFSFRRPRPDTSSLSLLHPRSVKQSLITQGTFLEQAQQMGSRPPSKQWNVLFGTWETWMKTQACLQKCTVTHTVSSIYKIHISITICFPLWSLSLYSKYKSFHTPSHKRFCFSRISISVLKCNNKTPHLLFSLDFTTLKYGGNYHKTTGSHLLACFLFFLHVCLLLLCVS